MKELSIEEKAKRYDKAIEKAKSWHVDAQVDFKKSLENLFPELKEGEEERIRKALIDGFTVMKESKNCGKTFSNHNIPVADILAWLEKQVQTFTKKDVDDAYSKGVTDTKNEIEKQCEANYQIRKDIATFIFNYKGIIKDRAKWMDYLGIKVSFIEKQDEQKPIDKVEPKFKIEKDKWYICIRDLDDNYGTRAFSKESIYYSTKDETLIPDNSNVPSEIKYYVNDYFRLWTIQDAKDGDVLVNWNNTVFIFKAIEDETVKFHIAYNEKWNAVKTPSTKLSHLGLPEPQFEFHPATKEQCGLLFKKMKEAGYEWDADKKELKKIEQEQVIDYPDSFPKDNWELIHEFVEKFGKIPDEYELNVLMEYVLNRQKPTVWSEEDEKYLKLAIDNFQTLGNSFLTTWLKSLKYRYTWKPSYEQMEALTNALSLAKNCGEENAFDLRILYEQLKKLRGEQL